MNATVSSLRDIETCVVQDGNLVERILAMDKLAPELRHSIGRRFSELASMHSLLRSLPQASGTGRLRGEARGVETLVSELLRRDRGERLLYIPARATMGRAAVVIKAQAWAAVCRAIRELNPDGSELGDAEVQAEAAVLELLAEDVYLSVLDGPASDEVRRLAATRLVELWDLRPDLALDPHAQALMAVWNSRALNPPAFGTLLGSSELVGLSLGLDREWFEFAAACFGNQDILAALEEFLFGLSHEELVEARLVVSEKGPIGREDIAMILGGQRDYPEAATSDPRDMYRFYEFRRRRSRVRSSAGLPGPRATLEEYYLQWGLGATGLIS